MQPDKIEIPIIEVAADAKIIARNYQYFLFYPAYFVHRCNYVEEIEVDGLPEQRHWQWSYNYLKSAVVSHGFSRTLAENGEWVFEYEIHCLGIKSPVIILFEDDVDKVITFRDKFRDYLAWQKS